MTPEPTPGTRWLRTRDADLVAETLSDETLVIDTVSGVFYSLRGVASALWSMLEGTATDDELRAAVHQRFADARSADVDAFVAALEADALVVVADAARSGEVAAGEVAAGEVAAVAWPDTYEPPALQKYDDMADLLLVDPIHDVTSETGWPERRRDTP